MEVITLKDPAGLEPMWFDVNGTKIDVKLTGAEIKRLADQPLEYQLELLPEHEVIDNDKIVAMHVGMRFECGPHGHTS